MKVIIVYLLRKTADIVWATGDALKRVACNMHGLAARKEKNGR